MELLIEESTSVAPVPSAELSKENILSFLGEGDRFTAVFSEEEELTACVPHVEPLPEFDSQAAYTAAVRFSRTEDNGEVYIIMNKMEFYNNRTPPSLIEARRMMQKFCSRVDSSLLSGKIIVTVISDGTRYSAESI